MKRLAYISHPECHLHEMGMGHPESPYRLKAIQKGIEESSLSSYLEVFEAPLADKNDLLRVHDESYIENLFKLSPLSGYQSIDPDTTMNPHTLEAALRAAGAILMGVDLVMEGKFKAVFCAVRPPGHHAERNRAMGFCFFNNVAVGAAYALEKYALDRVAIIDFDVHAGNGTEHIFLEDPRLLFCSTFQDPLYPGLPFARNNAHILNAPLPAGADSKEFRSVVEEKLIPVLKSFKPQLVFFSAGFDAHTEDPLAQLELQDEDYAWITRKVKEATSSSSKGMISTLEGGYHLGALSRAVPLHLKAMM